MTRDLAPDSWNKPSDKPMPALPQDRPATGNRTIFVLVDSTQPAHADVQATTIAALHHWGIPYEVWDVGRGPLPKKAALDRAGMLIAQEHFGKCVTKELAESILVSLREGTGLCSLDPWLHEYPSSFTRAIGLRAGADGKRDTLAVADNAHFICSLRDENESIRLRQPVATRSITGDGIDQLHESLLHAGNVGKGRVVWWGVSPQVWLAPTLGHGWGLDDLFWRGIVWVARKPFAMKAMPPFANMRFDDSGGLSGLNWMQGHVAALKTPLPPELRRILELKPGGAASVLNEFEYVKILNRFGWKPEVSLFVDQVRDQDWKALKEIYDRGGVQVSCHALRDGYDANGHWQSHFLTQKGLEVKTKDGPRFCHCISPDTFAEDSGPYVFSILRGEPLPPYRFVPWPDDVLEANFRHLDELWQRKGIQPGRTTNIHWRNPPSNCLEPLKRRGQTFSMWTARYNYATVDPAAYDWRMLPYGNAGMCLDYMPIPENATSITPGDFFNVQAHVFLPALKYDPIASDVDFFRCKKPPRPGLLTHHDLDLVAESIAHQAKLGLQGLFFACPLTHEMNLATLTAEEWTAVLTDVERRLRRYPKEFVLYDTIATAARAKCETHIESVAWNGNALDVQLEGNAETDLTLSVFEDEGPSCRCRFIRAPSFAGSARVSI